MNIFHESLNHISSQILSIVTAPSVYDDFNAYFEKVEAELDNFKRTGSFTIQEGISSIKKERITNIVPVDESSKENVNNNNIQPSRRTTRAVVNAQNNLNNAKTQMVKLERISEVNPVSNDVMDMPPPQEPVRKGRTKKPASVLKIKKEQCSISTEDRESDVYIQSDRVSIINLTDTEDIVKDKPIRSTRTKTRAIATNEGNEVKKKNISQSPEEEEFLEKEEETKIKKIAGTDRKIKILPKVKKEPNADDQSAADNIKDNKCDSKEKPIRTTRTKTRAMAAKQNQVEHEKNEISADITTIGTSLKEKETSESVEQKAVAEDIEKSNYKVVEQPKEVGKRSHSISPIFNESKRQKATECDNQKLCDETYVKTPEKGNKNQDPSNQTIVINKQNVADETVIIPKDQRVVVTTPLNKQINLSDLMTDDEDEKSYNKTKNQKHTKPLFNTFENSPVKKRVEAFEKLGVQYAANDPPKLAKKTKQKQTADGEDKSKPESLLKPTIKSKVKMFTGTPLKNVSKLVAPSSQSASKFSKTGLKEIVLPPKSASALKAYQQDFIEREQRKQEKEKEVARKREALLQMKKDESKRKREEKQLKAQQAREALIKTKQETLQESDKLQPKKYKQVLSEKVAKIGEHKHMANEKKPQEGKKEMVGKLLTKVTKDVTPVRKYLQKPIYLEKSPPLLPLEDCYDSDDERRENRVYRPGWTRRNKILSVLASITAAGNEVTNTLFMRKATTPDLIMLFGRVNPNKLKRTSSAIWNKPPRFTIMPIPNEEDEENLL